MNSKSKQPLFHFYHCEESTVRFGLEVALKDRNKSFQRSRLHVSQMTTRKHQRTTQQLFFCLTSGFIVRETQEVI